MNTTRGVTSNIKRIVDELSRGQGRFIISASGNNEAAYENATWGHGAFTKAIIEALIEGRADRNNDGINIAEFKAYLKSRVPEMTEGRQHPLSRENIAGEDFRFYLK